jgi:alkylation response protein AidB-like acyl-CoA dehydrogenase
MDFDDTPREAAFRAEARAWLEDNARPKPLGQLSTVRSFYQFDEQFVAEGKAWQATLYSGGWAGIAWPREWGGRGGTVMEEVVFRQEEAGFDVPSGLFAVAIGMVGPTLIGHGTDRQRAQFLPPMLSGQTVWCQLFSEPSSGSDLASLLTRAELDGDEWVVNGQKVWSSGAHLSDMGILLARTDPDQPKHRGITCFLVDMGSPGIDIRPLRQMTGGATFNQVFFSDVRVPAQNIVGGINAGWRAAITTLANERNVGGGASVFPQLLQLARQCAVVEDAVTRQRLADTFVRTEILRYLGFRAQTAISRGTPAGPETSVIKLFHASTMKAVADTALGLQGPGGAVMGQPALGNGYWQDQFLSAPSLRIAAGTDETQRNIIAERVLGLPREVRIDRDAPFRAASVTS